MRRGLVMTVALLALGVPGAHASSVVGTVVRVTPTTGYFWLQSYDVDAGPAATAFMEIGVDTTYGSVIPWASNLSGANSGPAFIHPGLVPGTTYHLRGRLDQPGQQPVYGPDRIFTTPPLGGSLLSVPFEDFELATPMTGAPQEVSPMQTCADASQFVPGSSTSTRFHAYVVRNPAPVEGCVTVQVKSSCSSVRIGAYDGAGTPPMYQGPIVGASNGAGNNQEFQFKLGADASATLMVSDDGTCPGGYALNVFSTSAVAPTVTTATRAPNRRTLRHAAGGARRPTSCAAPSYWSSGGGRLRRSTSSRWTIRWPSTTPTTRSRCACKT